MKPNKDEFLKLSYYIIKKKYENDIKSLQGTDVMESGSLLIIILISKDGYVYISSYDTINDSHEVLKLDPIHKCVLNDPVLLKLSFEAVNEMTSFKTVNMGDNHDIS